jgi:hypothetical protein
MLKMRERRLVGRSLGELLLEKHSAVEITVLLLVHFDQPLVLPPHPSQPYIEGLKSDHFQ